MIAMDESTATIDVSEETPVNPNEYDTKEYWRWEAEYYENSSDYWDKSAKYWRDKYWLLRYGTDKPE